eukprot:SAG22_NODE_12505_length_440_cov_0.900293_1_plen_35_part_10
MATAAAGAAAGVLALVRSIACTRSGWFLASSACFG